MHANEAQERALALFAERIAQSDWDFDLIQRELSVLTPEYLDALEAACRTKNYKNLPVLPHVRARKKAAT